MKYVAAYKDDMSKPVLARSADKLVSEFDVFFQIVENEENIEDILSQYELDILQDAYDILMFVDKAATERHTNELRYK